MNALRKILMPLLLIPIGMFVYVSVHPDWHWENPGLEYLLIGVGVPIVAVNFVAWFYPEVITAYFPVKEDWGQRREKAVSIATLVSALVAFTCVGVGAVSAVLRNGTSPTFEPASVQSITATAFARSVQSPVDSINSGPIAIVSTARASLEATIIPEETVQIPVSGETLTSSPALAVPQTEASSVSIIPTGTVNLLARCIPATPEQLDALRQAVQDVDLDSEVETGWAVQSGTEEDLWFVAAKVHIPESDSQSTPPGVWGLVAYSVDEFDMYAINEAAKELSYTAWGEDREPALTMQSDGAQTALDCALQEQ